MSLMMCEGKYVGREEIANVPTPTGTASWHPVAHAEVIHAVTEAVKAHDWQILDEQYGLAIGALLGFGLNFAYSFLKYRSGNIPVKAAM